MQRELLRYTVRGMVVGGYGEGSPMLHKMLSWIANGMAAKDFCRLGFDNPVEARSTCMRYVRRDFATEAMIQQARLIHDRVDELELRQMPSYGFNDDRPPTFERFNHQADYFPPH